MIAEFSQTEVFLYAGAPAKGALHLLRRVVKGALQTHKQQNTQMQKNIYIYI